MADIENQEKEEEVKEESEDAEADKEDRKEAEEEKPDLGVQHLPKGGSTLELLSRASTPPEKRSRRYIRKIAYFFGLTLWIFGLAFGIYGAARVMSTTWRHYKESPTVISMERDYKEWNTSFPAVTLCPLEKYDNASLNDLVQTLPYQDKSGLRKFLIALSEATYGTFHKVPEFREINPSEYMRLILTIRHKFSYTVSGSSVETSTAGYLTPTITERGICYAFNSDVAIYNSPEYWEAGTVKELYSKGWDFNGSPLDGDTFAQIMDISSGYIVYVHGSNETSDISSHSLLAEKGTYKTLSVTAMSIYSTDETRSLTVDQRDCRFLEESNLVISPIYSYNLCRNQCRMKLAYRLCNCVPHFYKPTHQLPICDVQGMRCLDNHTSLLTKLRNPENGTKVKCNCVPACNDVNYVIENEHTMPWFLGTNLKYGIVNYPKMRLRRDTLFGFKDVLISVGSSIGLFLGCSLLSLMEVLYMMCIRLYRGLGQISRACCSCILGEAFTGRYRYLTSSALSDRSRISPSPVDRSTITVQSALEDRKLNGGLNAFVVQHI